MHWWEPFDWPFITNPYGAYARMHEELPLFWHEGLQSWVTVNHRICAGVLSDRGTFAADFRRAGMETDPSSISLQTLDPPDHAPWQRVIGRLTRPGNPREFTKQIQLVADQQAKKIVDDGGGDLINLIALPLATEAALRLLGAPKLTDEVAHLSQAIVASMNSGLAPELEEAGRQARGVLSSMISSWVQLGGSDLARRLSTLGLPIDCDSPVLANSIRVTLLAGINSTQRAIGLALLTLYSHSSVAPMLLQDDKLDAHVREIIRFDSPFQAQSRACVTDTTIADQRLARGDIVVALIGGANRDPTIYPMPNQLLFTRRTAEDLVFGRGPHACPGMRPALTIVGQALRTCARHLPKARLVGMPSFDRNPTLRGLIHLPVET